MQPNKYLIKNVYSQKLKAHVYYRFIVSRRMVPQHENSLHKVHH